MAEVKKPVRIGNAQAFWGDRADAAAEMLAREPELDYLTLDYLAEVSMSILAMQRERDPEAGFARDFVEVVRSLVPYWSSGGRCRVIANAGGLNPRGCVEACRLRVGGGRLPVDENRRRYGRRCFGIVARSGSGKNIERISQPRYGRCD